MMKNRLFKRLISLSLVVLSTFLLIVPAFAADDIKKESSSIKKNTLSINSLKQGSPLLSENGNDIYEISEEDHIGMLLYLSSFITPGKDSFTTAFDPGASEGSKGKFNEYTKFRSVSDEAQNIITQYIETICGIQSLKVDTLADAESGDATRWVYTDEGLTNKASQMSLFYQYYNDHGSGSSIYTPTTLYAKSLKDDTSIKVFDLNSSEYGAFCSFSRGSLDSDDSKPLYLDACGNICVSGDEKIPGKIIVPAAMNPTLYNGRFNLLTLELANRLKNAWWELHIDSADGTKYNSLTQEQEIIIDSNHIKADRLIHMMYDYDTLNATSAFNPQKSGGYLGLGIWGVVNRYVPTIQELEGKFTENSIKSKFCKQLYLNYLFMASGSDKYNPTGKPNDKGLKINTDFFNIEQINQLKSILESVKTVSKEEKTNGILDFIYTVVTTPFKIIDWLVGIINGLWNALYESVSDYKNTSRGINTNTIGFSTLDKLPWVSSLVDLIDNNIDWVIIIAFIVVMGLGILSRAPGKAFVRYIATLIILIFFPTIFNYFMQGANNLITKAFSLNQASWVLQYSQNWEKQNMNANTQYAQMYSQTQFESNSNLSYIQDKSPVVLNNGNEEVTSALSSGYFGRLFLGNIVKQYLRDNMVSGSMDEMFKRMTMLNYLYTEVGSDDLDLISSTQYYSNLFHSKSLKTASSQVADSGGFTPLVHNGEDSYMSYANKATRDIQTDNWKYLIMPEEENAEPGMYSPFATDLLTTLSTHKQNYILHSVSLNAPDWFSYKAENDSASGLDSAYDKYFAATSWNEESASPISRFNFYSTQKYDGDYGYFIGTENVIPYFYSVWWDTFAHCDAKDIGYLLQGYLDYSSEPSRDNNFKGTPEMVSIPDRNSSGGIDGFSQVSSRNSVLMNKSLIIDYVDLWTLFHNVVPYYYHMSLAATNHFGDAKIEDDYKIYKNNNKAWLFTANWAVKLMNAYCNEMNTDNVCEAHSLDINSKFEGLCQEFYAYLTPQIEDILESINNNGMSKDVIIRQLAILTALQFNKTFSIPGVQNYPQYIDIGSVNIDTLWKDLLATNGIAINPDFSASYNLMQESGHGFDMLLLALCSLVVCFLLPLVKIGASMALVFHVYICAAALPLRKNGSAWTFISGIFIAIFKVIFVFTLPTLVLLSFSTLKIGSKFNANVSLKLQIIIIAAVSIFAALAAINLLKVHIGIDPSTGRMNWGQFFDFGGEASLSNAASKLGKIGRVVGGAAFAMSGSGLAYNHLLKPGANAISNIPTAAVETVKNKAKLELAKSNVTGSGLARAMMGMDASARNQILSKEKMRLRQKAHDLNMSGKGSAAKEAYLKSKTIKSFSDSDI